jgi:hypothetical protein
VIYEQGTVSGTLSATVSSRSTAINTTQGAGTFTIYPKGGSFSCQAFTHGRLVGSTIYFTGTAKIVSGTGSWAHASSSNMRYTGTMNRQNYRITLHITGTIKH